MKNKAAVMTSLQNIEIMERPIPQIGPNDVLIKVEYCGICGSDVHFFERAALAPVRSSILRFSATKPREKSWQLAKM